MSANKKTRKPPKPAALFRKPIAEESFRKRCLGLIEQAADRAFLEASFARSGGSYVLKEGLSREDLLRLNKLAKAIAANRGFVKKGPLVLAGLLAAALAAFGLLFMNPLLERAAEAGLEAVFGARAEIASFRLDPFRLRVSIGALAVADRDEPMTNLFETGRLELRLNAASALRGRVYIEEASAARLSLGGPRSSSGALPGVPARQREGKPAASSAGRPILDLANFDAEALLEREKAKLSSAAAYERAGKAYDEAASRWKDRAASSKRAVGELSSSAKKAMAIDPKAFKTAPEALKAAADAKALLDASRAASKEASAVAAGLRADAARASALEKEARTSLDRDLAYLKSFVDPRSGAAAAVLEPLVADLLSEEGERYFYYAKRGLEAALALAKPAGAARTAEKPKAGLRSRGRDRAFPSAELPRFRLGLLGADFSSGDVSWKFELRELSSEPSLLAEPARLELSMEGGGRSAALSALLDQRVPAASYSAQARVAGFDLDLGDAFSSVGLEGLRGRAAGSLDLSGAAGGGLRAEGGLELREAAVRRTSGSLGPALASALAETKTLRAELGYEAGPAGEGRLSVRTNLDEVAAKAAAAAAARYAAKAGSELEAALRRYAGRELEGGLGSKGELSSLSSSAAADEASASASSEGLEAKSKGFEARAKELASKAVKGVELPKLKP
ncbi:MAG TPA: hypothetical protein P5142_16840 [Spirochaetia bacterium]|nr:hypothetical protein [Spirochaetia bacterium]